MDRNTAIQTWREVCGSDMVMTLPPTGRLLEAFAAKIEAAEREACARVCDEIRAAAEGEDRAHRSDIEFGKAEGAETCATRIRAR